MPPAIPIVVAAVLVAAEVSAIVIAVVVFALSFAISYLTAKKPKKPNLDLGFRAKAAGRTQTIRQPIGAHRIVYGQVRVGGVLNFAETTGTDNEYLHLVVTLGAGGPYEEIGDVWLDDDVIPSSYLDGSGDVTTGKFANLVRIKKHLGAHDQAADSDLDTETSVDSNFKGGGKCYVYVRLKNDKDVFSGIPSISAVVKGRKVYDMRGSPTQDPDDPSTWEWTDNAALCTLDYVRGVPMQVQDGTVKRLLGLNTPDASIDMDSFELAANTCEEQVTLVGSPLDYEDRYTANGVANTEQEPHVILNEMRTAFAGDLIHSGGVWEIIPGEYREPMITLDEDNLIDALKIRPRVARRELFNAVKGVFTSPNHSWQPTDFPSVTSATYEAEDNGERIWTDYDLPFTTSSSTAQRLAKLALEGSRRQMTIEASCNLTAFRIKAGSNIKVTNERMGLSEDVFYVSNWKLSVETGDDGVPFLAVKLTLRQTDEDVFNWSADETIISPELISSLPDPFTVQPPTGLTLTSGTDQLYVRNDGTVFSRIKVSWTSPADTNVLSGGRIEILYKKSADSVWDVWGTVNGAETFAHILDVQDGVTYDVATRSINNLGVRSDTGTPDTWSAVSLSHAVAGKTEAPPDVDTFNVTRLPDGTRRFVWSLDPVPADVKTGGGYQIKYKLGTGHTWDDLADLHSGLWLVSPYETNSLAAGTYTFGIKAVDSSGNVSANAVTIEATLGDPRLRNVLAVRDEYDEGWDGVKTDSFVNYAGNLEGIGSTGSPQGDWSGLPATWSAMSDSWLTVVTAQDTITYVSPEMDIGVNAGFTPVVSVDATGSVTTEMRVGTSADGSAEGSPDGDNPWVTVAPVSMSRYVQIRITVTGTSPIVYSMVTLLDAAVQVEDYEDYDTSSSTADDFESLGTGWFKLATRGSTAAITSAQITAFQNAGSGWSVELIDKATTLGGSPPYDDEPAAEFKIYKDGVLTDATIDATIRGVKA